jgi:2-polyprenyl-3-methyl-5-hydroxy-6-metoxy-1,4-benzoquinol methylase
MKKKKKNKRDDFISLVPDGVQRILDLGCAAGSLSAGLKTKGIEAIGVELDSFLAKQAKEKLDEVFIADIECFNPPFSNYYFDCILYADVLEHLKNPADILAKYKQYLNDKGCVIASIPNVRYYKLIIRLLFGGTWDYMDCGILDKSHLRFFAFINIKEMFEDAGYDIAVIKRNIVASRFARFLNFIFFGSLKDLLTYQYYIKAVKASPDKARASKRKRIQF